MRGPSNNSGDASRFIERLASGCLAASSTPRIRSDPSSCPCELCCDWDCSCDERSSACLPISCNSWSSSSSDNSLLRSLSWAAARNLSNKLRLATRSVGEGEPGGPGKSLNDMNRFALRGAPGGTVGVPAS